MTYREVYEELPYLLLVLMNADKPVVVAKDGSEPEIKTVSGKDMLKTKRGG